MKRIKIHGLTIEYEPEYTEDKHRREELVAELGGIPEVVQTMRSHGWRMVDQWARAKLRAWDQEISSLAVRLDKNTDEIRMIKQRQMGLADWMKLFTEVESKLLDGNEELQEIETRLQEE